MALKKKKHFSDLLGFDSSALAELGFRFDDLVIVTIETSAIFELAIHRGLIDIGAS